MSAPLPARLVGSAYSIDPAINDDEDARFPDVRIYAVGDAEYIVPQKTVWRDEEVAEDTVFLDKAEKIIDRPLDAGGKPTRIVTEMKRSADVEPEVRASLRAIVDQRYKPKPGYKVQIIEATPR